MSSEQLDREALRKIEQVMTGGNLGRLLEIFIQNAFGRHADTYAIGLTDLETFLKQPYQIEVVNLAELSDEVLNSSIDFEKFNALLEKEKIPCQFAIQDDTLYFYSKDKSIIDAHLEKLIASLKESPEKVKAIQADEAKDLSETIEAAKDRLPLTAVSVERKELVR